MKRIATMYDPDGKVCGLIHGPDASDQQIMVNGRIRRFEFERMTGPVWLRKDGSPNKCQCPGKASWDVWQK